MKNNDEHRLRNGINNVGNYQSSNGVLVRGFSSDNDESDGCSIS